VPETAPLRLTGGLVLGADGLRPGTVGMAGGRFADAAAGRALDVTGHWLLPGIVDLHGDGFERHLAPRRGVVSDLGAGLRALEVELAACGITTAWLAQFWSWEGGMRGPDFARRLAAALAAARPGLGLDLRLQLRLESHMTGDGAAVRALIAAHGIDYLVVNDHLSHAHLATGRPPPRLTGAALKAGRSPEAHLAEMRARHACGGEVPGFLAALAADLGARGVRLGAHDEADPAARARNAALGLDVAEFPLTRAAAQAAAEAGAPVVMGAPNVVRGGSHGRGVAAEGLVAAGLVTALASDYHYPAPLAAALALAERGVLPLPRAWALVSAGPAAAMGLADRGRIAQGLRADLIVLDPATRAVAACFAAGRPVHLSGAIAARALG